MDLLTIDECAARLRISVRTLQRLIADGRGPVLTRIGGKVFVRVDQLTGWIERNSVSRVVQAA